MAYRHGAPQQFGRVVSLHITDEHNREINRVPHTVEEANGIEPEPTLAKAKTATVEIRMWPLAQILIALLDLQRSEPRATELYWKLTEAETEINQLLSDVREREMVRLRAEHERVLGECRSVLAQIKELESQLPPLEGRLRPLQNATSPLRAALAAKRSAKPSVGHPQYATQQDVEAWRDSVDQAQARLTRAEQAEASVVAEYNVIVNKIKAHKELLNGHRANIAAVNDSDRPGLVEMESRLRAQIEGQPWSDASTGLKSTTAILR